MKMILFRIFVTIFILDINAGCSKETFDMVVQENTRLTRENGRLADSLLDKDKQIIDLLEKKIGDQANLNEKFNKRIWKSKDCMERLLNCGKHNLPKILSNWSKQLHFIPSLSK